MASRSCLHPAHAFCYVCGQFIKTRAKKFSVKSCHKMCEAYKAYFGMAVGDQDKSWAPHFTCEYCKKTLEGKVKNCYLLRWQCIILLNLSDFDLVQLKELQLPKFSHMSMYDRKICSVVIPYPVLRNLYNFLLLDLYNLLYLLCYRLV